MLFLDLVNVYGKLMRKLVGRRSSLKVIVSKNNNEHIWLLQKNKFCFQSNQSFSGTALRSKQCCYSVLTCRYWSRDAVLILLAVLIKLHSVIQKHTLLAWGGWMYCTLCKNYVQFVSAWRIFGQARHSTIGLSYVLWILLRQLAKLALYY